MVSEVIAAEMYRRLNDPRDIGHLEVEAWMNRLTACPACNGEREIRVFADDVFVGRVPCPQCKDATLPAAEPADTGRGQDAVAWRYRYYDSDGWTYKQERPADPPRDNPYGKVIEPLYARPPSGAAAAEVLRFYADPKNYESRETCDGNGYCPSEIDNDGGKKARAALNSQPARSQP